MTKYHFLWKFVATGIFEKKLQKLSKISIETIIGIKELKLSFNN